MTSAVTFRLDGQTRQRVVKIARRRGVSVSEAIRQAVEAWVEREHVSCSPYVYQATRNPSCMFRPSSALVIVPTVAFEMFVSGLPKLL
jgi:hypothetical protein